MTHENIGFLFVCLLLFGAGLTKQKGERKGRKLIKRAIMFVTTFILSHNIHTYKEKHYLIALYLVKYCLKQKNNTMPDQVLITSPPGFN